MTNIFTVFAERIDSYTSAKGGQVTTRRVDLLDASQPALPQFFELNLPAEHPELGPGKQVMVRIDGVLGIFNGRARIAGAIIGNGSIAPGVTGPTPRAK
jgi:hypothetical protein